MTYSVGDTVALYYDMPQPLIGVITVLKNHTVHVYWFNTGHTGRYDIEELERSIVAYVEPRESI